MADRNRRFSGTKSHFLLYKYSIRPAVHLNNDSQNAGNNIVVELLLLFLYLYRSNEVTHVCRLP